MRRHFHILDVFTDTKLAGNPLAVVLDSEGLDAAAMQSIAREFNLSETVFCTPPRDPVNTAAVRIFTPRAELPFAGHPTIGTAVLLATSRAPDLLAREDVGIVLEEAIGPVSCSARQRPGAAPHARFEVPRLPEPWGPPPPADAIADQLGLSVADIGFAAFRSCRFSVGNPVTFVPVASLEALGRVRLAAAEGRPEMVYAFTPLEGQATRTFRSRMVSAGYGVPEDPATGSAAAAFPAALLASERLADGDHDCVLLQGVEMGRPSRIGVAFSVLDSALASVTIGGSAVVVAEGVLDV